MRIVIDIDEENYKSCLTSEYVRKVIYCDLVSAIRKGTILPKGHGRLIDADAIISKMNERIDELKDDRSMYEASCVETALDMFAPTIIEADKENDKDV